MNSARTTAIYGDNSAQVATIVPDLGAVSDGTSIVVSANSEQFNIRQILALDDSIYDTNNEELYASINSPGNVTIQGSTTGWVAKRDMILEIPMTFNSYSVENTTEPAFFGGRILQMQGTQRWDNLIQPAYAFLQPIKRFQAAIGENNLLMGNQTMSYLHGIRQVAADYTGTSQSIPIMTNLGLPVSRTTKVDTLNGNNFFDFTAIPIAIRDHWNQVLKMCAYRTLSSEPYTVRVGIPLYMLNSFWASDRDSYLPPGLKFRFTFEYDTGVVEVARVANIASTLKQRGTLSVTYGTNMTLIYPRHQLRQPLQAEINTQWLQKPFLYNTLTYETVEVPMDGINTHFSKDIAISQQRPTQIILTVLPPDNSLSEIEIVEGTGFPIISTMYPNSSCPAKFSNVRVSLSGRQNYLLNTRTAFGSLDGGAIMDATQMLNETVNQETYLDGGSGVRYTISKMNGMFNEGNKLVINLNPGNMEQHGSMSTDQGAITIKVDADIQVPTGSTSKAFPSGYRLVVYKKLPNQVMIDASKNVTEINWPAVKSNSGFVIASTFNQN